METDLEKERPNIRIEIKNTHDDKMDVDEVEEEGEIRDNVPTERNIQDEVERPKGFFHRHMQMDPEKLKERAKRFALKPDEISTLNKQDLNNLYTSLGITEENADDIRFKAIYLRTNQLNIHNIMAYFMDYTLDSIELIDNESCNVVFNDELTAAKTLVSISQSVQGMPVRVVSKHLDSLDFDESPNILTQNRQIELRDDSEENSVDISIINIPIPPGYWRLGKKQIESMSVLLRFSMKMDKEPMEIVKSSAYFKNKTNKYNGIFSRNKEMKTDKNPWGVLAENWDEDYKFREREHYKQETPPIIENTELRTRLTAKRRLRKDEPKEEEIERKMPRMKMYADEEEEKIKRKKLLQTLKRQNEKLKETEIANSDLRNILRIGKRPKTNEIDVDLSKTLKNRTRKLVFSVAQDKRTRIMDRLDKPKSKSPIRYETRERHRIEKYKRNETIEDDDYNVQKTRSKVALVIKTHKPSVASAIQSRSRKFDASSTSSDESSNDSSDSSISSSEDSRKGKRIIKIE